MQINVFDRYFKKMYFFVNQKRKARLEEFEPKRNPSCDSAQYIFSVMIRTPSRRHNFDYCCYPTKVCRTYIKYDQIDSSNQKTPISIFKLMLCNDQKNESLLRRNLNAQTHITAYQSANCISSEVSEKWVSLIANLKTMFQNGH